jgi:hypothetical protein
MAVMANNLKRKMSQLTLKSSYLSQIEDWIQKSDDGSVESQEHIASQLSVEFDRLSLQGKVTFGFRYCKNEENELRGRVGMYSGWRVGTRAFKFIPDNRIPFSRSKEPTCIRYYDFGRMSWRSFKKNLFVVCSSFYSAEEDKWFDTPEEAGFTSTWNNDNHLYQRVEREDSVEENAKRAKIFRQQRDKRTAQIERNRKKQRIVIPTITNGRVVLKSV